MPRCVDLYADFGFKKLFGEEANKDSLIDFLNAVLPTENHVADLAFRFSARICSCSIDASDWLEPPMSINSST
ncbi:MAG: Rpn family recombination-promoting nuclease/putative transposase [Planctomycetaceae bacterium]|nr:Rpn family recombination-promoting nuclease/putative transposase [Planctomycetaceae bacterium]